MVRDGFYFLIPLLAGALVALWIGWTIVVWILAGLAAFVAFFFRDPYREIPEDPNVIVAPADGRIVRLDREQRVEISIFLSLFDVHVNRAPIDGEVTEVRYRRGRFRAAFRQEATLENEQNTLEISATGRRIECSQIAGLVARRIVCWKQAGDMVQKGERIGLIRFGSRVDLSLPPEVVLEVAMGDRVKGGTSRIGVLK